MKCPNCNCELEMKIRERDGSETKISDTSNTTLIKKELKKKK